ncbi:MAG TPA: hypothetical protein VF773_01880 [Verrucomicrobiae bacterium]
MEQLIIFLLFVVGSLISAYVQKKKAQAEERQQRELEELTSRGRGPQPPAPRKAQSEWPQTAGDWQEQLRRMLQGETVAPPPPVIIKPVLLPPQKTAPQQTTSRKPPPPRLPQSSLPVHEKSEGDAEFQSRLKVSNANYERASKIQETVQARLRAASDQTTSHKPAVVIQRPRRGHADFLRRLRRNRTALREAFVTSLVFGPAKSVEFETPTELKPVPRAI